MSTFLWIYPYLLLHQLSNFSLSHTFILSTNGILIVRLPWRPLKSLKNASFWSGTLTSTTQLWSQEMQEQSDWNNYYNGLSISSTFFLLKESVNAFTMCPWVNTMICCFHILYHLLSFFVTQILDLWFPGQIDVTSLTQVVFLWTLLSPSWGQLITSLVSLVCNYASVRA